jgi:hypothetical protein
MPKINSSRQNLCLINFFEKISRCLLVIIMNSYGGGGDNDDDDDKENNNNKNKYM